MKIIGIDLAGKEKNPSGICVLYKNQVILKTLYQDEEILKEIKQINPSLIAFDAPLSLPKGRCCLEKNCKCFVGWHFRATEREIRPLVGCFPLPSGG